MKLTFTIKKQGFLLILLALFMSNQALNAQVFWSEDFSNGLPSDWVNEDITSVAGEEVIFVHTTDVNEIAGPALGNAETSVMMSSTGDNGYIYANSDRGLSAAPAVNHTTELTTSAIDCSGQDVVFFRVESVIGVFDQDANLNAILQVSTDGGNAWTDYELFPGLTTSVRWSDNPAVTVVDLSAQAANQSEVFIRFRWFGGWEYFWAIDDISLTSDNPRPPHDMTVNSPLGDFYAIAPNAVTPASQIEPFGFLADVANIGSEDQSNVNLNISIFQNNSNNASYSGDLAYGTVAAGAIVENQIIPGFFTPDAAPASYTGTYTISSDSTSLDADMDNNVQDFAFEVSETVFAKETGATRAVRPADANWADGEAHSWAYGNCFYVPNGTGWYGKSVEFGLANADEIPGQQVTLWLYKWEDANGDLQSQDDERTRVAVGFHEIAGTEADEIISVDLFNFLDNSVVNPLEDDSYYLVMADFTSPDATTDLLLQASEAYDYSAMNFLADSLQAPRYAAFLAIGGESEYSSTGFGLDIVPVVRLTITDEPVSVEELTDNNKIEVYPNPARSIITADVELEEVASELNIRIVDVEGRLIVNEYFDNIQKNQFTYDVSKWTSGAYFMHLVTEKGVKTKRFMVQQ